MWSARLNESQDSIKIAGRNIKNLRYADDTILMAASEEELKSLLMKVKEESEKADLILNIQKTKIVASSSFSSVQFISVTQLCLTLCESRDCSTRPPCLSPTPRVYSNSCRLSWWCHPAISSSVIPFSSHLQSFPASGSFPRSQFSLESLWDLKSLSLLKSMRVLSSLCAKNMSIFHKKCFIRKWELGNSPWFPLALATKTQTCWEASALELCLAVLWGWSSAVRGDSWQAPSPTGVTQGYTEGQLHTDGTPQGLAGGWNSRAGALHTSFFILFSFFSLPSPSPYHTAWRF